ncbi:uncharacterized protein M421DRAFT_98812 [Didymella exigua CBS 183.55]|uniref:N-acetyltransferase domain-containing protein n=1 Tax=Didymella exigua CBS 183.55 TaxID=1150837 RepID=A0A6A5RTI4_9PLEO|nr:uncharacterized protein M421DRAFT_98812 [Didymella exigua CBS 183.55]KAF1931721.1 hypothetical protein M421DRAFT_98812 [Didymella exigua CBS 183.55]
MLDPNFHITTRRLHLSYLDPANDANMSFVVRLNSSPESVAVKAQAGVKNFHHPQTIPEARAAYTSTAERLERTGSGRYIISLRKSDVEFNEETGEREYAGIVSMQLKRYPDLDCPTIPDIGFSLMAAYHGKGYATEACEALMKYFKEEKGHKRFAGFTHPDNVNSQKLFNRLGFESRGTMELAGILGDGSAFTVAVWTKNVSLDTKLSDLGIGPRLAEESVVGHLKESVGV